MLAGLSGAADYRLATGMQVDAEGHGMLDVVFRGDDWSAGLLTDTVDARWTPELERGKAWVGGRAEGFAAGLMISPWTDGRPDPGRARIAAYGGVELGVQRYLRRGFYVGVEGNARYYAFFPMATTVGEVPDARPVVHADAVIGWYKPFASAKLRPGLDLAPGSPEAAAQPHVVAEAQLQPAWKLAPRVEIRAAWGDSKDEVTRTRLGGLNPYVVPLAGAVWAEWWVEDYAAARLGPQWTAKAFEVAWLADAAWFDGQSALGFAIDSKVQHKRFYVDADIGLAPWIPRPDGHTRLSIWAAVGLDWGPLAR